MSGFSNWIDPNWSNSASQNSSAPSQRVNNPSQNAEVRPIVSLPNMPNAQHFTINPQIISPEFLHQAYIQQMYAMQACLPQMRPPQVDLSQGSTISVASRRSYEESDQGAPSSGKAPTQGTENINLYTKTQLDEGNCQPEKRRAFYSNAECEVLAKCWIEVSIDSVVGNDQKGEQMWTRVGEAYNINRPINTPMREITQLKAQFYKMQKLTKLFSECYNRIARIPISGKNDADLLDMAQEEYKMHHGHGKQTFKYIGVWRILSTCPKFAEVQGDVHASKRSKNSEEGAYSNSSNTGETHTSRPMGQKAAKRKAKGKGKKEDIAIVAEVAKQHEANLKDAIYLRQYDILMRDTSNMTEERRRTHEMACNEIKRKWAAEGREI